MTGAGCKVAPLELSWGIVIGAACVCVAWYWGGGLLFRASGAPQPLASTLRPWLFLGPTLLLVCAYLLFPIINSLWRSVHDADGGSWVGLANYHWLMRDPHFREALANTLLWLLVVPAAATLVGLLSAYLSEQVSWGGLARALMFLPMTISFVGAAVIWKLVYEYRGPGLAQTGLLNAILVEFGAAPQAWLALPFWNSIFLMAVLIWVQAGFATVILAAALRGLEREVSEAAALEGASDWQIFLHIRLPQIWGAVAVVWTAISIAALKVFDIVFVMTNGQWGTQVLATLMYEWTFRGSPDFGRGSAIAILLMVLLLPILLWNMRAAYKQER
jgi:alpha-glucoside transport system permease protein